MKKQLRRVRGNGLRESIEEAVRQVRITDDLGKSGELSAPAQSGSFGQRIRNLAKVIASSSTQVGSRL